MCSCNQPRPNAPSWLGSLRASARGNRGRHLVLLVHIVGLATLIGLLAYKLSPTDLERAEADLERAREIVLALDGESAACQAAAKAHRARAAAFRERAEEREDEWQEWHRALADTHAQLSRANSARRDNLAHLTAGYLRLLAEAECEILRAKNARDRGTPYEVAPRVRALLAPVLGGR